MQAIGLLTGAGGESSGTPKSINLDGVNKSLNNRIMLSIIKGQGSGVEPSLNSNGELAVLQMRSQTNN